MSDYNVPGNLKYYKEHEWIKILADNSVVIGISDYAQQTLTDVTYVEFKVKIGATVTAGDIVGEIESVKSVSDVYIPISGKILETNEEILEEDPELVNSSPYDKGWFFKLEPSNSEEIKALMDADQYQTYIASL